MDQDFYEENKEGDEYPDPRVLKNEQEYEEAEHEYSPENNSAPTEGPLFTKPGPNVGGSN